MNVVGMAGGADAATTLNSNRTLTFTGFVNVAQSSQDERVLVGERAAWEAGASAPVRLSFAKKPKVEAPTAVAATSVGNGSSGSRSSGTGRVANGAPAVKTWKLALDDDDDGGGGMFGAGGGGAGGDDDLVDEDALLENSAPVKRPAETVSAWNMHDDFGFSVVCFLSIRYLRGSELRLTTA